MKLTQRVLRCNVVMEMAFLTQVINHNMEKHGTPCLNSTRCTFPWTSKAFPVNPGWDCVESVCGTGEHVLEYVLESDASTDLHLTSLTH